jgi:hypothetical protein
MKPTKAVQTQRVDAIVLMRLGGGTFTDVRQYVAEKEAAGEPPWTIPEGGRPVSERSLWRYIERADKEIATACREGRKRRWNRHLAQRRYLYAMAVSQADVRAALAVLDSEAKLHGMFPPTKTELTGKGGAPVVLQIVEEVVGPEPGRPLQVEEEVLTHDDARTAAAADSARQEGPAPPGPEGLPRQ